MYKPSWSKLSHKQQQVSPFNGKVNTVLVALLLDTDYKFDFLVLTVSVQCG